MKKYLYTLLFLSMPLTALAQDATETVIDFKGEIVDQDAAPVSGVLPLEFRVFTEKNAKKAIATEKHFVSIVDGEYALSLGESSQIKTKNATLFVAVYLDGKELTRQEVRTQQQIVKKNSQIVETDVTPNTGDFKLECPKGYVVTGIQGNSKNGVQNFKLICSKTV
ncbi:MAG: hypothetical protein J6A01_05175 [Proteobacteria bacterium]|nr:hypothetical protein [Pseudomonadota bacterium]